MSYVDGLVIPVPTAKRAEFEAGARIFNAFFLECGALQAMDCWQDDVPHGKLTDFHRAVAAEPVESIVFSWVVWPSKEIRDAAHAKMRSDSRMNSSSMPFDGRRMIFGGFTPISGNDA